MESRKYQLQQQIVDALTSNDNELYSILKSQWAHRFGVESLEELENLDISKITQNSKIEDKQEIDQSLVYLSEGDNEISLEVDDKQEEIINFAKKEVKPVELENKESFEVKSYEIVQKGNHVNKALDQSNVYKSPPKVEALIPLPPKPKYSFLKKWLLRS